MPQIYHNPPGGGDSESVDLYYFTDNAYYHYVLDGVEDLLNIDHNISINTYECDWSNDFYQAFHAFLQIDGFDTISNAKVVFEMSKGFEKQTYPSPNLMPFLLDDLFEELQLRHCDIMFICDTEEVRFNNADDQGRRFNEFLDHVDVHINTDMITVFVDSFI